MSLGSVVVGAGGVCRMVKFGILGPVEFTDGVKPLSVGGPRQVALLAFLLLNANRAVSVDQLIEALWAENVGGGVKALHTSVARLRKALGTNGSDIEPALKTVSGGYLLAVKPGELDADVFQVGVENGRRALDQGEALDAIRVLREALELWRGPALAEVAYEAFAQSEIRRLEELRLQALEARIEADLQLGHHSRVIAELEALVASHPGREQLVGQLMIALYRSGRQSESLEAYSRARQALVSEIGVEPGPQLQRLHEAVLRQDSSLELPRPAPTLPPELDATSASALVGRDRELNWLTRRLGPCGDRRRRPDRAARRARDREESAGRRARGSCAGGGRDRPLRDGQRPSGRRTRRPGAGSRLNKSDPPRGRSRRRSTTGHAG